MQRPTLIRTFLIAAVVALVGVVPVTGQQTPPPQQQMSDSTRALLQELQQVQQKLSQIRQKALQQNGDLRQRRDTIQKIVQDAMREEDPQLDERMGRLDSMRAEMQAARQSQDTQKMRKLMMEARGVQQKIQAAQAAALQREDVAKEVDSFETDLIAEMKKVDPEAAKLLARADEIVAELRS